MGAIALGLSAALSWGLADFLGGVLSRRVTLALVLLVSQLAAIAAIAVVVLGARLGLPDLDATVPAVLAGLCQLVAIAALYRALAIGTMSIVSPVSAAGAAVLPVIVGIASGERPAVLQYAGMAIALAGAILACRRPDRSGSDVLPRRALLLSAVAALGFGGFYVGMDTAIEDAEPLSALLVARVAAGVLLLGAIAAARPTLGSPDRLLGALALIGILDAGANVCFTLGTDTGLLSIVSVLASLYPILTVILARAVLAERIAPVQAVGVGLALAGVALIAAG